MVTLMHVSGPKSCPRYAFSKDHFSLRRGPDIQGDALALQQPHEHGGTTVRLRRDDLKSNGRMRRILPEEKGLRKGSLLGTGIVKPPQPALFLSPVSRSHRTASRTCAETLDSQLRPSNATAGRATGHWPRDSLSRMRTRPDLCETAAPRSPVLPCQ